MRVETVRKVDFELVGGILCFLDLVIIFILPLILNLFHNFIIRYILILQPVSLPLLPLIPILLLEFRRVLNFVLQYLTFLFLFHLHSVFLPS